MARQTGECRLTETHGETVRAFVPHPLPPRDPPLDVESLRDVLDATLLAMAQFSAAFATVQNPDWFPYVFIRREAVVTSQIEGTDATLRDLVEFETTRATDRPDDVAEIINYRDALNYALEQMANPQGLPPSTRLLCEAHRRLMRGNRERGKSPGQLRRSQNWIGGSRPGNARYVPPPPGAVSDGLGALERWIHQNHDHPPLIRLALAHAQFEIIHPFLDGNGRIGRLLITLLIAQWKLLPTPLLSPSLAFRRRQVEYYERLRGVSAKGDWEGWVRFFLTCLQSAATDGMAVALKLNSLAEQARQKILGSPRATMVATRLLELLRLGPFVTPSDVSRRLEVTPPTAYKAISVLDSLGILRESTGKKRNRVWVWEDYIRILSADGEI